MARTINFPEGAAKPVTITVNGVAVLRASIAREMQHHPAQTPLAAWTEAARALVIKELLSQEAARTHVVAEALVDESGRRETDQEAAIRALIDRDVVTPEPDDDSCRRYHRQNRQRFRSPDIYEASHILFAAPARDGEAYAAARTEAERVLAVLRDDPHAFADLAGQYSACPSGQHGGNLGQITAGDTTPEFEKALFGIEQGTIREEPLPTRYGHHIVRLDGKHPGRELPYELVADRIADYLRENVRRRAIAQYIARLVSAAQIGGIELAGREALRVQ